MDFRSCCRANCKDMYANCDAIDSSLPVSDDHCYPKSDGTCDQAEDCCYKTCHSWNGETCPAGTTRRSEHDRHRCHYNVCNAAECCQEPSMCEKWKNSGGTCTNEKPQHKNPDDRHHCSDDNCDADECCSELHCNGDGTTKTDQKCKCGGADCNVGQFCHDNHMCSDESKKDESNNGKDESQECKDIKAITHKDEQSDNDAGTYVSQCYDVSTNSEEDITKWTFKKGTGSCTICKDALQLRFGPKCEGAPGKDCKHCQGIIDAYKDCPKTDKAPKTGEGKDSKTDIDSKTVSNTVTPTFSVAHTITLEGISAAEFMADPKIILSFQESIATTLKVDVDKIVNIKAKSSRRQLSGRGMAAAGCRYI